MLPRLLALTSRIDAYSLRDWVRGRMTEPLGELIRGHLGMELDPPCGGFESVGLEAARATGKRDRRGLQL